MNQTRTFLLGLLFTIGCFNQANSQVGGTFFAVHCDPPNSIYWSSLVDIVDSANAYNVPLTIMMTPPWADSVFSNPSKASQLALWQLQGHEVAYHHHGITAMNASSWDGYTNATDGEILAEGLNPADKIGDMNDYMAFMLPLAGNQPVTSAGIGTESEWPEGLIYRTNAENFDQTDVFSMITSYNHNGHDVCGLTYSNVNSTSVGYAIGQFNNFSSDYYAGLITHAHDFVSDLSKRTATRTWFQFIADSIQPMTVQDIMVNGTCALAVSNTELSLEDGFEIFPNPTLSSKTTTVRLYIDEAQTVFVRIHDLSGKVMSLEKFDASFGENEIEVMIEKLDAGSYFVEVESDSFNAIKPLVIQ